ncbi:hypothetical protein TNCV_4793871 [Trichonephila clavipes]|nr:hypothetical protein TNCV_4793871 [Trichonephila clavipes]
MKYRFSATYRLKKSTFLAREIDSLIDPSQIASATYESFRTTATAGSDVVKSGRLIFDDFFQHLWPYIGNNTATVVFQMVKRLWLIRIDQ